MRTPGILPQLKSVIHSFMDLNLYWRRRRRSSIIYTDYTDQVPLISFDYRPRSLVFHVVPPYTVLPDMRGCWVVEQGCISRPQPERADGDFSHAHDSTGLHAGYSMLAHL